MNYKIIENFLSKEKCNSLISSAENFLSNSDVIHYHGNRSDIASSYKSFTEMTKKSTEWKELDVYLQSQDFFDFVCNNLKIENKNIEVKKFYNLQEYQIINNNRKNISLIPDTQLLKVFLYRKWRNMKRWLKFNNIINKKKYTELLYSFARAGNKYKQDIHRDSDQRLIVFLIYLNETSRDSVGGNFDLYKKIGVIDDVKEPNKNSLEKIISIMPSAGKLILFQNNDDAYHGVEIMRDHKIYRNFIYGAFTLLDKKNPYISKHEIPIERYLY
tara:strand:+ start:461 stop:1276 length:816 start_codon:yes stop_codon:yes gene_type:complete